QPFDRSYFRAIGLRNRNQAAVDELAVEQDGTRTTFAFAATFFCAGEMQLAPEDIEQAFHREDVRFGRCAVDGQMEPTFAGMESIGHQWFADENTCGLSAARMSSGSNGIELKRAPSASFTAFTIAGAGPSIGSSPIPFAP